MPTAIDADPAARPPTVPGARQTLRFGPFVLDGPGGRLLREGEAVALAPKPFAVLSHLAARPGLLVSKDELLDAVWGHRFVSDSVLKVAMNGLRAALREDAKAPQWLHTVARRGYRFADPEPAPGDVTADAAPPRVKTSAEPVLLPPPSPARAAGNLPLVMAPIWGRDGDLARLQALLVTHRLATLTGLGGVGKTRLALATAAALALELPDGRWMLRLEDLTDPALIVPSLAQLLHLGEPAASGAAALAKALAGQRLLLVLDNAEHLVDAVAELVSAVLAEAPGVRLLVTSQRPLRLGIEQVLPLAPLALPADSGDSAPVPDSYAAAQLLCARIQQLLPQWAPQPGDNADIAAICRALDGVPLALELAAARVPTLGLARVRQRLDQRFALLTRGPRDATARHRTLAAALDWTFSLLSEAERQALQALAVFAGSFSVEDAEGVLGTDDALELLEELCTRSLVVADTPPQGLRLRLFDSVRRMALDGLAQAGRETEVRLSHLRWMAGRFQGLRRTELFTPTLHWLALLRPDLDSLRAALRFGLAPGAPAEAMDAAASLAASSVHLWLRSGHRREGWAWLQQALALQSMQPPVLSAGTQLLLDDAHGAYTSNAQLGDPRQALHALRRAQLQHAQAQDLLASYLALAAEFALLNRLGSDFDGSAIVARMGACLQPDWPPFAHRHHARLQAMVCRQQADWAGFLHGMERCALICRDADARFEAWQAVFSMAQALSLLGRDEEACALGEAAVDEVRAHGLLREQLYLVATVASLQLRVGRPQARRSALEALRLLMADDMVWWMADALPWAAWHAGRAADALQLQAWADGLAEARGEKRGPFYSRMREALMAQMAATGRDRVLSAGPLGLDQARAIDLALGAGTAASVMTRSALPN